MIRTDSVFAVGVEAHPFEPGEFDSKNHRIMFLASPPGQEARSITDLSPHDRHLGVVATARNLPTCHKILDLLAA